MASSVVGMTDAFNIASNLAIQSGRAEELASFQTSVVTSDGRSVRAFGGIPIASNGSLPTLTLNDIVVIPPIVGDVERVLRREYELVRWLRMRAGSAAIISSVCSGAFLLAEAGLLKGKRATTNPALAALFHRRYPGITLQTEQRLVSQLSVITAGTTTAYIDLAVHIVERVAGYDLALLTAKALAVDKNAGSQLPYTLTVGDKEHGDEHVRMIQDWLEGSFQRPLAAEDMALKSGLSVRSLNRRFHDNIGMSPVEYLRRLRVEAAKRILEEGRVSLESMTHMVGYEDPRSFFRLFQMMTGLSPAGYRDRFAARPGTRPLSVAQEQPAMAVSHT